MELDRTAANEATAQRRARAAAAGRPCSTQRRVLDSAYRGPVGRPSWPISTIPDLPPTLPRVGEVRCVQSAAGGVGRGLTKSRLTGSVGVLYRRHFRSGEKRGLCVGKTKRGKGTKLMAVADRHGLPVAVHVASASPHEITLAPDTVGGRFVASAPARLIGDRAYDSDKLDAELAAQGIELIAPHKSNRTRAPTQDGRALRRYKRRWKIERLFAWLQNFRRILSRHEYHVANYLGFVHLGCLVILIRHF